MRDDAMESLRLGGVHPHGEVAAGESLEVVAIDIVGPAAVEKPHPIRRTHETCGGSEVVLLDAVVCRVLGIDSEGAVLSAAQGEAVPDDGGQSRVLSPDATVVAGEDRIRDGEGPGATAAVVGIHGVVKTREGAPLKVFVGTGLGVHVRVRVFAAGRGGKAGVVRLDGAPPRRHACRFWIDGKMAAYEFEAADIIEMRVPFEGLRAEVVVVDGEGAVAEGGVVGKLLAAVRYVINIV